MAANQNDHVLDNLCWYALTSHHAPFASGMALAKRYPPEMWDQSALADHSDAAFRDLHRITPVGEITVLFEANPPQAMPDWSIHNILKVDQLICQQRVPEPEHVVEITDLTASDLPEILRLIDLTLPGTFFPRTIEMGRHIGIRKEGQLIAMAGERVHALGYCEISAVCTHPDWRGRGYARLLCSLLVNGIWDRGEVPFLHVFPDNMLAYRLYEGLHFTKRSDMTPIFMSHL